MLKILFVIAALIGVWTVFRWVEQAGKSRRVKEDRSETRRMRSAGVAGAETATDTILCTRCGVYVPAGNATACSRPDCPFPR